MSNLVYGRGEAIQGLMDVRGSIKDTCLRSLARSRRESASGKNGHATLVGDSTQLYDFSLAAFLRSTETHKLRTDGCCNVIRLFASSRLLAQTPLVVPALSVRRPIVVSSLRPENATCLPGYPRIQSLRGFGRERGRIK